MATQKNKILSHLREYGKITTYECFIKLGCTTLSQRIGELVKDGYNIFSDILPGDKHATYTLVRK